VFLTISINFHKPMSVEYIFIIAGGFTVAHMKDGKMMIHQPIMG
jgi:hypothetical protein